MRRAPPICAIATGMVRDNGASGSGAAACRRVSTQASAHRSSGAPALAGSIAGATAETYGRSLAEGAQQLEKVHSVVVCHGPSQMTIIGAHDATTARHATRAARHRRGGFLLPSFTAEISNMRENRRQITHPRASQGGSQDAVQETTATSGRPGVARTEDAGWFRNPSDRI